MTALNVATPTATRTPVTNTGPLTVASAVKNLQRILEPNGIFYQNPTASRSELAWEAGVTLSAIAKEDHPFNVFHPYRRASNDAFQAHKHFEREAWDMAYNEVYSALDRLNAPYKPKAVSVRVV